VPIDCRVEHMWIVPFVGDNYKVPNNFN